MPPERLGEDIFLEIAAKTNEIGHGILMTHAHDILMNDGSLVEISGDIVAGGTDDLHAALERLMIGPSANEGR